MAKYSDIKGFTVQTVSTDPSAAAPLAGTWSSGGNMNTARSNGGSFGASKDSAIVGTGMTNPASGPSRVTNSETYDGSSWSEVSEVNSARYNSAFFGAVYTAGIIATGYTTTSTNLVEQWNGSAWTEIAETNESKYGASGAGIAA